MIHDIEYDLQASGTLRQLALIDSANDATMFTMEQIAGEDAAGMQSHCFSSNCRLAARLCGTSLGGLFWSVVKHLTRAAHVLDERGPPHPPRLHPAASSQS